jgi:hypothetical protein
MGPLVAPDGSELSPVAPQPEVDTEGQAQTSEQGFNSFGISGLTRYGPVSRIYEEFLRELQGPQGMKSYREMMDNDPIVGAIMFAAQHLCRKVSFHIKPADSTPEARAVADFVGGCLFDDMEATWPDTLSEIITMIPFGWALMEFRMKRRMGMEPINFTPPDASVSGENGIGTPVSDFAPSRFEDGGIGFRSWSLRSQETLFMWEFDEDSNATVMQQMAPPDYRIRRIPLTKSLLFRTQVAKNNPEGRSALRNAWVSYYMKKNLQVFEGIGVERDLAGYPMIQIEKPDINNGLAVPDIWNAQDPKMVTLLAAMQKIVRSVRRDEQEGMVMPWWAKFSLVSSGSRRAHDTNSIISRYDQRIAMSMMADFIMLGHEAVGSKALAATKISLFTSALSSFMDTASAVVDRRAIPTLLKFNGIPMELAPTLEHGDVESINIQELGEFISKLAGTGFNPLASFEAQKAVLEAARIPTTGIVDPSAPNVSGELGDSTSDISGYGAPVDPQGTTTGAPSVLTAKSAQAARVGLAKMQADVAALGAGLTALNDNFKKYFDMATPPAPPNVTVHSHAAPVTINPPDINVHAAPVTVHPPGIHVDAPDIHVDAPEITVVTSDGREMIVDRTVKRDAQGNLLGSIDRVRRE